jgi:uncharacterized protein YukE
MTTLDLNVPGDPSSVLKAANWLRSILVSELEDASREARKAIDSEGDWRGRAADAFRSRMTETNRLVKDLADAAGHSGVAIRDYGHALEDAQEAANRLLLEAQSAGLKTTGTLVTIPPQADFPDSIHRATDPDWCHNQTATASLWSAYEGVERGFNDVQAALTQAVAALVKASRELERLAVPNLLTAVGYASGIYLAYEGAIKDYRAGELREHWNKRAPELSARGAKRRSQSRLLTRAKELDGLAASLRAAGRVLGVGFVGLGVYLDTKDGESLTQAIVSQGGSALVGAGVATGASALAGMIAGGAGGSPVPGIGTVIGAVLGVAISIGGNYWVDQSWTN